MLIRELRAGLTSEDVRSAMQAVAEEHGCELPDEVIVSHGAQSAIGHESGYGEIGAGEPVVVDIWPRDKASRCWADMTRTFVAGGGEPPAELAEFHRLTRDSLERVYADLRAGANGRALFERSCEPYIEAGQPTQLTKEPGQVLEDGYFHGLGHGVGLEVHERPFMGRLGDELLAGDVVTVEPGCYRRGFGGCRLEDLVRRDRGRIRDPHRFPVRPVIDAQRRHQLAVELVAVHQLGVGADRPDAARVHHHDLVGVQHRREPVGDGDHRCREATSAMQACSARSVMPSTWAVASSSSSTSGVRRTARATASRWRWPPESWPAWSEVSRPSGSAATASLIRTESSAACTSASVPSGWVNSRLSRTDPGTSGVSCST